MHTSIVLRGNVNNLIRMLHITVQHHGPSNVQPASDFSAQNSIETSRHWQFFALPSDRRVLRTQCPRVCWTFDTASTAWLAFSRKIHQRLPRPSSTALDSIELLRCIAPAWEEENIDQIINRTTSLESFLSRNVLEQFTWMAATFSLSICSV